MNRHVAFGVFCLLAISLVACGPKKPRGIVLVISDGTSQELITATRNFQAGAKGRLALEGMSQSAIVRTYSASDLVTDSSAAATAMARGVKVNSRVVGQFKADSPEYPPSILDLAKRAGWSTAVVSDDSVTGATPASFLVEHPKREESPQIARKIIGNLGKRADLVLGGGRKWFQDLVKEMPYEPDKLDYVRETESQLKASGVEVFDDWEKFAGYVEGGGSAGKPVLGLFSPDAFSYYADGKRKLRLVDMTRAALKVLKARGKPFLLVVEAGLPDKASHQNQALRAMTEVLELDATIDYLRQEKDILLLATTDHNTGGFAFNGYVDADKKGNVLLLKNPKTDRFPFTWSSGPGADPNINTVKRTVQEPGQSMREEIVELGPLDPEFRQPALISAPKGSLHTGGDVWLLGEGPGSEGVRGYLDNTEVFNIMARSIGPR